MTELFEKPIIYLITSGDANSSNFARERKRILEIIRAAVESSVSLIQIREKQLSARLVFELTTNAAQITSNSKTKLLLNDRADIALAAGANGVHLTANSLPAGIIREAFRKDFIVGVSVHSLEKAKTAKLDGADFVTFAPVFSTPNKGAPKGLEELRRVCGSLAPFPVIALGGLNETNYQSVLDGGASGFAAIRYLNDLYAEKKI